MTRSKAIRAYCLWCCVDQPVEVRHCGAKYSCPLWRYRMGRETKEECGYLNSNGDVITKRLTRGRAIRERCLNCGGWSTTDVRKCTFTDCPLQEYRMGRKTKV